MVSRRRERLTVGWACTSDLSQAPPTTEHRTGEHRAGIAADIGPGILRPATREALTFRPGDLAT
jgi:hypothetical protein